MHTRTIMNFIELLCYFLATAPINPHWVNSHTQCSPTALSGPLSLSYSPSIQGSLSSLVYIATYSTPGRARWSTRILRGKVYVLLSEPVNRYSVLSRRARCNIFLDAPYKKFNHTKSIHNPSIQVIRTCHGYKQRYSDERCHYIGIFKA